MPRCSPIAHQGELVYNGTTALFGAAMGGWLLVRSGWSLRLHEVSHLDVPGYVAGSLGSRREGRAADRRQNLVKHSFRPSGSA